MKNSLIIGFGRRVKGMLIPALQLVNDGETYVYSRTIEKVITDKNKYNVHPISELNDDILKKISKIFISIPNSSVLEILRKLLKYQTKEINLYIDTPIIPPASNIMIKNYIKYFKNIFVLEDFCYNPLNEIIEKLCTSNQLGNFKNIKFINNGYSYHSLAQTRYLLKNRKINFAIKLKDQLIFYFAGCKITITGDRIDKGYTIIKTQNSSICINNQDISCDFNIGYIFEEQVISGYKINNKILEIPTNLKNNLSKLKKICNKYDIYKRHSQEQVISLLYLITQCEMNEGKKYLFEDGVNDSFVVAVANKVKIYFDFNLFKKSILLSIFKIISSIIFFRKKNLVSNEKYNKLS